MDIRIQTWGSQGIGTINVRNNNGRPPEDAVRSSIERRTGLDMYMWQAETTDDDSITWAGTLTRDGQPVGQIWASLPRHSVAYIHTAPTGRYYADDDTRGTLTEDGPGYPTVGQALRACAAAGYTHYRVSTWQRDGVKAIPRRYYNR